MVGIRIQFTNGSSLLDKSGYTLEEQGQIYDYQLQDVIENTRWYLDNIEFMREFRVSWVDYKTQKWTKPIEFVDKTKATNFKKAKPL